MSGRRVAYVRHEGNIYPARHWAELSRFAVGDERDPRGLFRLADDVWDAWPYAEAGRPTTAVNYRFYFTGLRSFLKLYIKWYCYERLLISVDTPWSGAERMACILKRADRFIVGRGLISIDDIAPQAAFEELWVELLTQPVADGETRRTQAAVGYQMKSRLFWLRLSSCFGVPHVVPPTTPYIRKLPTEYADDASQVIPEHVIKQLANKLGLHRDVVEPLNRYNHLRLCVVMLGICLGRRVGELLSAPRVEGADGPLGERQPVAGRKTAHCGSGITPVSAVRPRRCTSVPSGKMSRPTACGS